MKTTNLVLTVVGLIVATAGCGGNAEVARVATQAADRQAQQNDELARLNREVAAGTKNMVEADAQARKDLIVAQQQLQSQQADIGRGRDLLETERQHIARQRQSVSMWTPVLQGLGIALVAALTIGLCWSLLHGLRSNDDSNQELGELLVMELTAARRQLTAYEPDDAPQLGELDNSIPGVPAISTTSPPNPEENTL